jgi:hypothetical protein
MALFSPANLEYVLQILSGELLLKAGHTTNLVSVFHFYSTAFMILTVGGTLSQRTLGGNINNDFLGLLLKLPFHFPDGGSDSTPSLKLHP